MPILIGRGNSLSAISLYKWLRLNPETASTSESRIRSLAWAAGALVWLKGQSRTYHLLQYVDYLFAGIVGRSTTASRTLKSRFKCPLQASSEGPPPLSHPIDQEARPSRFRRVIFACIASGSFNSYSWPSRSAAAAPFLPLEPRLDALSAPHAPWLSMCSVRYRRRDPRPERLYRQPGLCGMKRTASTTLLPGCSP